MRNFDQELKDKWCAALRSGKYQRDTAMLYCSAGNTYCCLGVLGEVCGLSKGVMNGKPLFSEKQSIISIFSDEEMKGVMDKVPANFIGTCAENSIVEDLVYWNGCLTFKEIADYIEKNL